MRAPLALFLGLTLAASANLRAEDVDGQPSQTRFTEPGVRAAAPSTWKGAFEDSLRLLMIEHTTRIAFQEKTRRELGGPFFRDYGRSVKIPDTWNDGDSWAVNYVGHPIHGAASGFIWLDHEAGAHDPSLRFSRSYWASRGRATTWAAVYSLQFEFGPLSEASIGNVGMRPGTTGWVDHVVTPTFECFERVSRRRATATNPVPTRSNVDGSGTTCGLDPVIVTRSNGF